MLVVIALPRLPLGSNDDSSWSAVLGYAHQKGLHFGSEIIFTYGPLGFLTTPYQCPMAPGLRLLSDLGISFVSAAGVCLLAWRLGWLWRVVLLGAFALLAANVEPRSELLLNVGLLSWGMLCLGQTGWRAVSSAAVLVGFSAFAALTKVSFLFVAPLVIGAVAWDNAVRRRWWLAAGVPACCALGTALLWVILGQKLTDLGRFLMEALTFSTGYAGAMQAKDYPTLTWTALCLLMAGVCGVVVSGWHDLRRLGNLAWYRGGLMTCWCVWLFLAWKHGFVREDRDHTEMFFGAVPVMVLLLLTVSPSEQPARNWLCGIGCGCFLLSMFAFQWLFAGNVRSCLMRPVHLVAEHLQAVAHPAASRERQREMQAAEVAAMQLTRVREKVGPGSVDVFGQNQAYAVFNELNYRPRPVFQSYAAYNQPLMKFNEQFYFSATAPDYVLFRLDAIDDRFPPLEDALLFRDLLVNYTPVDAEGPFLLLKAHQSKLPRLELLSAGTIRPGQPLEVGSYHGADLWLELNLEPSAAGRAIAAVYQAPRVELGVWCQGRTGLRLAKFRAPPSMLAAGFVASPMLLDNHDVLDLYTSGPIIRPVGYSVELEPGTARDWQPGIQFRLFKIQDKLGRSAPPELSRLLKYPGFDLAPAAVVARTNALLQIRGHPALYLPPGSYMRFVVPTGAKQVKGSFGFAPAAYLLGGVTEGAEFRIEEEFPDGRIQLVHSRILRPVTNPDDRGLQPFAYDLPGDGPRELLFRILPLAAQSGPSDLTCWADIGFR